MCRRRTLTLSVLLLAFCADCCAQYTACIQDIDAAVAASPLIRAGIVVNSAGQLLCKSLYDSIIFPTYSFSGTCLKSSAARIAVCYRYIKDPVALVSNLTGTVVLSSDCVAASEKAQVCQRDDPASSSTCTQAIEFPHLDHLQGLPVTGTPACQTFRELPALCSAANFGAIYSRGSAMLACACTPSIVEDACIGMLQVSAALNSACTGYCKYLTTPPTPSASASATITASPSSSSTFTATLPSTESTTPRRSATLHPTNSSSASVSATTPLTITLTRTATPRLTQTGSGSMTFTHPVTNSASRSVTSTPLPSASTTATASVPVTASATRSVTPKPITPTCSPSASHTFTLVTTSSRSLTQTSSPSVTAPRTPSASPSVSSTQSLMRSWTPSPSYSLSKTLTISVLPSPTRSPSATFTRTPSNSADRELNPWKVSLVQPGIATAGLPMVLQVVGRNLAVGNLVSLIPLIDKLCPLLQDASSQLADVSSDRELGRVTVTPPWSTETNPATRCTRPVRDPSGECVCDYSKTFQTNSSVCNVGCCYVLCVSTLKSQTLHTHAIVDGADTSRGSLRLLRSSILVYHNKFREEPSPATNGIYPAPKASFFSNYEVGLGVACGITLLIAIFAVIMGLLLRRRRLKHRHRKDRLRRAYDVNGWDDVSAPIPQHQLTNEVDFVSMSDIRYGSLSSSSYMYQGGDGVLSKF